LSNKGLGLFPVATKNPPILQKSAKPCKRCKGRFCIAPPAGWAHEPHCHHPLNCKKGTQNHRRQGAEECFFSGAGDFLCWSGFQGWAGGLVITFFKNARWNKKSPGDFPRAFVWWVAVPVAARRAVSFGGL
jgi:hypothetical protein